MRNKILAITIVVGLLSWASRHAQLDDAMIYARYIANALAGQGLVFNPGEHINALTSPFYSYLLLACSWLLHGNVLLATTVVSAVAMIGSCILAERLVPYAGLILASTGYFYWLVGMESTLFIFMLLLVTTLYLKERWDCLPVVLLLLMLTRFEGGALAVVVVWHMWKRRVFPRWTAYLPMSLLVSAYFWLNYHYYGQPLPQSTTAKIGQGLSGFWGAWPQGFLRMEMHNIPKTVAWTPYIPLLALYFASKGLRAKRDSRLSGIILPSLGIILAFYVLFNVPGYLWYAAPFVCFLLLYAAYGIPDTLLAHRVLAGVIFVAVASNFFCLHRQNGDDYYHLAGKWLSDNTSADARIESVEIGQIGWYSHRYLIDILGLTTPKNAVHIAHRDATSWLAEDKPDYIIVHKNAWIWENVAVESPDYELVDTQFPQVEILRRRLGTQ